MLARKQLIAATAALLAGCSGGGSDGSGADLLQGCRSIGGGGTQTAQTVSPTCAGCGVSQPGGAIDGDGATYATIDMPANVGGTVTLRATAQPGIVYAAGSLAGMVHSLSYPDSVAVDIRLSTYAGGVQQEMFTFNTGTGGSSQPPDQPGRVSYPTSMQYDAIELSFTRASGAGIVAGRIHEFCSN